MFLDYRLVDTLRLGLRHTHACDEWATQALRLQGQPRFDRLIGALHADE